jgi:hypothetical protein
MTFGTVVLTLRNLLMGYSKQCGYEDWQVHRVMDSGSFALHT